MIDWHKYPSFDPGDFCCPCGCGFCDVDEDLLVVLTDLEQWSGGKVLVAPGNRCKKYNALGGGSKTSWHTKGGAADIDVKGRSAHEVYDYLTAKYPDKYGIGYYNIIEDGVEKEWVHVDIRPTAVRWQKIGSR